MLKYHGEKVNKNIFLNLHKSLSKSVKGLTNIVEENMFTMRYITEYENEESILAD
jgi:hypothetical protein